MLNRLAPLLIAAALGSAATLAWVGVERDRDASAPPRDTPVESPMTTAESTLPPDHPPIGNGSPANQETALPPNHPSVGSGSLGGAMPAPLDEPPALSWKMPDDWQEAPNPSRLRLATYHVPGGAR
jgi:hypothetical protein